MKKTIKKSMSLIMVLLMMFGIFAGTTSVFAANNNVPSTYNSGTKKIVGQVDLSNVTHSDGQEVEKDGKLFYDGTVGGSVEASDLFEGAYDKFVADFKGQNEPITRNPYENLVMFDKGKEFPSIKYTVTFPKNFIINENDITATENTATIGKIEKSYDKENNAVTFRLFLGSWNDYKGFFELYEKEKGTTGHPITINIPYSVEITDQTTTNLGTISANGKCELYKYGGFFGYGANVVNVTSKPLSFDVMR